MSQALCLVEEVPSRYRNAPKFGSKFPTRETLREIGYESKVLPSPHWYLGVAILSHRELPEKPEVRICQLAGAEQDGPRFMTVDLGGLWVSSVYAPYGPKSLGKRGAIERRVAWLYRLRDHVCHEGCDRWLLSGDFNVKVKADGAPKPEREIYSEKEQDALEELLRFGLSTSIAERIVAPLKIQVGLGVSARKPDQRRLPPAPDSREQVLGAGSPVRVCVS